MLDGIFGNCALFFMVFIRLSGAILFNPLLGRKNVPVGIKAGLAFLCALVATGTLGSIDIRIGDWVTFAVVCAKELAVGLAAGFVMNLLFSVAIVAGELMDLQLGVSMSKIYDPQSNSSVPLSGTILNLLLTLLFFVSNGHLTFIRMIVLTFQVVPPGAVMPGADFAKYLVMLLTEVMVMAIKIALPVIAIETISEFGMGVLMRAVPQINIFVAGIQLRTLLGLLIFMLIVPVLANLLDFSVGVMFDKLDGVFRLMT